MTSSNNTIFDDVFRTMLTKIPELIIPLVNEVFDTSYPPDISITRYQNELYDHHQKKITEKDLDDMVRPILATSASHTYITMQNVRVPAILPCISECLNMTLLSDWNISPA